MQFGGQILSGLFLIHSRDIIHRDLHIDNILYVAAGNQITLKIADFGIAKVLQPGGDSKAATFIGREYDYAPELINQGFTSRQSDLYQVGLVLYFLNRGTPAVGKNDGPAVQVCKLLSAGGHEWRCAKAFRTARWCSG